MRQWIARLRAGLVVSGAQLRHHRLRLGLAVVGVALAVLAVTLLAGAGVGVLETGTHQFESADRDLWVVSGETRLTTAGGGGFENSLYDSRSVATEIEAREEVRHAAPLAFDTVYVASNPNETFQTVVATGVPGGGPAVTVTEGEQFSGDPHYANGTYEGERTNEVLIDAETARQLEVDVGDTIYVGGSLATARNTPVTVVGISPTFERMLGVPTVTLPLSELHAVTGETAFEPATFITITLEDDADVEAVKRDLEQTYPEYEINTNQEQLEAVLQEQVLVLAAGATLVGLAIVAGIALTLTLLSLVVYQQRQSFAALRAVGLPSSLLLIVVAGQGVAVGVLGGLLGVVVTPPAVSLLNRLAGVVVGFDGLVRTDPAIYAGGFTIAVGIGTVAAVIAGWRLSRTSALEGL
ncbi:ABC transporter permease [Natronosalvus rutilus]|uniref:ABC transporter permease n=1 Tax=Natronosalvus rutilus TaxID=2953753 RepID=A0A9E7NDA7_9EURY|nr:ABC transporter permease [Natronosalvus rutilus]UTF54844.1 ABC transporter permease [Natronosalvus rutilus]